MKKLILSTLSLFVGIMLYGQQDYQLTHYKFMKPAFNPAATGIHGGYCASLVYRNQWDAKVTGAPNTVVFNAEAKIKSISSGVGLTFEHDAIGFNRSNYLRLNYAYHYPINGIGTIAGGLGLGMINVGNNGNWIPPDSYSDALIPTTGVSATNFDMNAGIYFKGVQGYYVGFSAAHLTKPDLKAINYESVNHFYVLGGYDFSTASTPDLEFQPSFLVKFISGVTSFDINFNVMWREMLWGGVSYRLQDAVAIMLGYQHKMEGENGNRSRFRVGYSFDIVTNGLRQYTYASHEIFLNYCFIPKLLIVIYIMLIY